MGTGTASNFNPTVYCPLCGRENALGRRNCFFCKQRLPDLSSAPPPPPPLPPPLPPDEPTVDQPNREAAEDKPLDHQGPIEQLPIEQLSSQDESGPASKTAAEIPEPPVISSEVESLKALLEKAQNESQQLRQLLEPMQAELDKAKAAFADVAHLPGHAAELTTKLKAAQDESQNLRQVMQPMQAELDKAQAAFAGVAHLPGHVAQLTADLQSANARVAGVEAHASDLASKWKSAEQTAAEFKQKFFDKATELEAFLKKNPELNPNRNLKYIFGIITAIGSLGGYGAGYYIHPKNDPNADQKAVQLAAQVTNAQKQIGDLNSALKSATGKTQETQQQAQADLDAANQKASDLASHQQQLQQKFNEALAQKQTAVEQVKSQDKAELEAANHKVSELTTREQQLQQQLKETVAQRTSAYTTITERNAEIASLHAQLSPRGSFVWSGTLTGKRTIEIKNGAPDFGTLSGTLPQRPCKVSTQDGRVKLKSRPSKNHLNDMSFEVTASGPAQVRIDWESD